GLNETALVPSANNQSNARWVPRGALGLFFFFGMTYFLFGLSLLSIAISRDGPPATILLGIPVWVVGGMMLVRWVGAKPLTERGAEVSRAARDRVGAAARSADPVGRVAVYGPTGLSRTALAGLAAALVVTAGTIAAGTADGAGGCGGAGGCSGCGGCGGCG